MSAGRCWMRLSRFPMVAASWSTVLAARLPRSFFMFAHAPDWVELVGVAGQPDDGQPVRVRTGELAHQTSDLQLL
jgi:hypothetical protein